MILDISHWYIINIAVHWLIVKKARMGFKLHVISMPGFYSHFDWCYYTMNLLSAAPWNLDEDTVMDKHGAKGLISKNYISFHKWNYLILHTNSKWWNRGFPEICQCFNIPEWSLNCRNAGFKHHGQCTHWCKCDNQHLTNGSHFLCQYHKSSLPRLLCRPIWFVLVMMIALTQYIQWRL